VREHSGAYGIGVDDAYTLVHEAPEWVAHGARIGRRPATRRDAPKPEFPRRML